AVQHITRLNPSQLNGVLNYPGDAIHLMIEFDDSKEGAQKKALKSLQKLAERAGGHVQFAGNIEERERINKLKHSVATLLWSNNGGRRALPVAEDVSLPLDRL